MTDTTAKDVLAITHMPAYDPHPAANSQFTDRLPAYAPADQGGFYHFGPVRIGDDGDLQYTVEPALASITVRGPKDPIAKGDHLTLTADGDQVAGDNIAPLTVPVADPASHVWSSADPRIASVDPSTGALTAHRPGSVTVSVTSGGVTGGTRVVVRSPADRRGGCPARPDTPLPRRERAALR
ncbi:Ig-like domain-containing protein [Streptomyces sp. NPDC001228]|uniref:Ig-like domain-containing protein n=1 Tax=Streptomyces sp. NPDC001228 TaxID=3154381 RepID=UPI00331AC750